MPDLEAERRRLEREIAAEKTKIDIAYWAFTRRANAPPPVLAVPKAYARRKALKEKLDDVKRKIADAAVTA